MFKQSDSTYPTDNQSPRFAETIGEVKRKKQNELMTERKANKLPPTAKLAAAHNMKTAIACAVDITISRIDKLVLVLPLEALTEHEMLAATARLQATNLVTRKSSKSDAYSLIQVLRCDNGTKIVFATRPTKPNMHYSLKITFNPDLMDKQAALQLLSALKLLFVLDWKAMLGLMLIYRVDQAYDFPVSVASLLIQLPGARVESKFFVATDNKLQVQTWYTGSIHAKTHWCTYDQIANDAYKAQHKVPVGRRVGPKQDAEFLVESGMKGTSTRLEARRLFDKPMSLSDVDALGRTKPFPMVDVYQVDDEKMKAGPQGFCTYTDSVRLRGVAGARSYFLSNETDAGAKKRLLAYEQHLTACTAPFWDKARMNSSLVDALKRLVVWNVLKHLIR